MRIGVQSEAVRLERLQHILTSPADQRSALLAGQAERSPNADRVEDRQDIERRVVRKRIQWIFDIYKYGNGRHSRRLPGYTRANMSLYERRPGAQTHWISFENPHAGRGQAGLENHGAKGHAFDSVRAGDSRVLLSEHGSGMITRMWMTIDDRSPEMLAALWIDIYWDYSPKPAVSVPFGDFFGVALGRKVGFENALFSDPEGRSFNCFIPMPFRKAVKVVLRNTSTKDLLRLFYDIDILLELHHSPETMYFHATWRHEKPNHLGEDFVIMPRTAGSGRFLGCNLGIVADVRYEGTWWGEGEVKMCLGADKHATICGTGTEDYIGTGWGQGAYSHRTQGCLIADKTARHWCFYRFHVDDPVFFESKLEVSIQTMGGSQARHVAELIDNGVPAIPITIDTGVVGGFIKLLEGNPSDYRKPQYAEHWCNFWRQDEWSGTAYFYLDSANGQHAG